jgi:hypothetical protein
MLDCNFQRESVRQLPERMLQLTLRAKGRRRPGEGEEKNRAAANNEIVGF